MDTLWRLLLLFALVLANAFFAMSEIAVISLNDAKIDRLAAEGNKKALRVRKLSGDSGRFLSMIQIGVTLAGFLASAGAAESFHAPLSNLLTRQLGERWHGLMDMAVTVLITLVISYFTLVLGELVPKRLAMRYPEKIALRLGGALGMFSALFRPLVWAVTHSANGVLRLVGVDPSVGEAAVTEEEIRLLVEAGGEKGVIEETQQEMINNIFEFDDIDVGDVMTHRTDIIGVEADAPLQSAVDLAMAEGCSRIPVYEEDMDSVIGILYIKDLLKYIGAPLPEGQSLRSLMREAYFVPETKRCGELFKEMTAKRIQIAVVVDEYGGTAGLATLEDVLESIVGSIQDEYDDEDEEIQKVDESTFRLDGQTAIDEVEQLTGVALPQGDYDTIAGFVISELGYLPRPGDAPVVEFGRLRFTVETVEDKRIAAVTVVIGPEAADQ